MQFDVHGAPLDVRCADAVLADDVRTLLWQFEALAPGTAARLELHALEAGDRAGLPRPGAPLPPEGDGARGAGSPSPRGAGAGGGGRTGGGGAGGRGGRGGGGGGVAAPRARGVAGRGAGAGGGGPRAGARARARAGARIGGSVFRPPPFRLSFPAGSR